MRLYGGSFKRALVTAGLVCSLAAYGCMGKSAKSVADTYLADLKLFNYANCYALLSQRDRMDRKFEDFLTDVPMGPDVSRDWFKNIERKTVYTVGEGQGRGDRMIIPVKVTTANLSLWERTANAEADGEPPTLLAQKRLEDGTFPKTSYDDSVVLIREDGQWRVLVDFEHKRQAQELRRQATDAMHRHDLDQAANLLHRVLALLAENPATGNGRLILHCQCQLREVQTAQAQRAEAQSYLRRLRLANVTLRLTATRVAGIFGELANLGDRALDEVILKVTYYEGSGAARRAVYSEEHAPVVTPLQFTNFNYPVRPMVPGEVRDFGFRLNAPADIQQHATPQLSVSAISFTQSQAPLPKKYRARLASPGHQESDGSLGVVPVQVERSSY